MSQALATDQLHERVRWVWEHLPGQVERLLDVGCHDGAPTAVFARRARLAVGVDLDTPVLQRGAERFAGIHLAAATGDRLPFRDGAFDCVVFSEVLEHVPAERESACIAEIRRVLKTDGTLILTTPYRGAFWWLDPLMQKTPLRTLAGLARGQRRRLKGHKHYRLREVQALLSPAFQIVQVERLACLLYPLAYWGHLLPFGLGRRPALTRLWQALMDYDFRQDYGARAYNLCIVARALPE